MSFNILKAFIKNKRKFKINRKIYKHKLKKYFFENIKIKKIKN